MNGSPGGEALTGDGEPMGEIRCAAVDPVDEEEEGHPDAARNRDKTVNTGKKPVYNSQL